MKTVLYTDAAFGKVDDGGRQGGHLLFIIDNHGKWNLLSWQSKRICRIAYSTLAAEAIAMADSIESDFYVLVLLICKGNNSLHYTLRSYKCAADKQI